MLAIQDVQVYPDPDSEALRGWTVLVDGGRIAQLGPNLPIPAGATVIPGRGRTLVAGFWNCHIHLTEPVWRGARTSNAGRLNDQLREMFGRRGFTTVVDLGSDPRIGLSVRERLDRGELVGPRLLTAGVPLYPPAGIPFYVRDAVPFYVRWFMPKPSSPRAATAAVNRGIDRGCDVVKLFTGSYVARGTVRPMPGAVAAAAVTAAHARGRLVFAHSSNLAGTMVALRSGVDVVAHAPDSTEGVDRPVLRALVDRRMAMIPTLKMFGTTVTPDPGYLEPIYWVVREFRDAGGELLFGTDVGYMTDYTTEGEFSALAASGLGWREILRMLTLAPARRFGVEKIRGTVEVGRAADLVLLDGDPALDIAAFSRVSLTLRGGQPIWGPV
jgi:imidazolonepropionase-like amidohydrolase